MSTRRFSVGRLMAVVVVVALNLAGAQRLAALDEMLVIGILPAAIVLQLAFFRLILTEGSRRAFWAGFLVAGLLMVLSFVWANRLSGSVGIAKDPVTRKKVFVFVPGSFGGDRLHSIWSGYANLVVHYFPSLPQSRIVSAAILFTPQMLAAMAGGFFASRVKRIRSFSASRSEFRTPG